MSPFLLSHLLSELGCPRGPGRGLGHHVTVPPLPTQIGPSDLHNVQQQEETTLLQVAARELSREGASWLKVRDGMGWGGTGLDRVGG